MQVAVNFPNETIAQKILWFLEKFRDDGVEVIKIDDNDEDILNNFKQGLEEIKLINQGKLKARPIEEFLDEL